MEGVGMNKKYVVNKEIAVRMKDLGFKQESEFYWIELPEDGRFTGICDDGLVRKNTVELFGKYNKQMIKTIYSAYLTGELGEILPRALTFKNCNGIVKRLSYTARTKKDAESWFGCGAWGTLNIDCLKYSLGGTHADKDRWNVRYLTCSPESLLITNCQEKTMPNAMGLMACYLKEQKLLEVKDEERTT